MPLPNPFGEDDTPGDKLQKFLSAAGVASRRHAEVMIKQGRVTVNGKQAELGMRVVEGDQVRVSGVLVGAEAPRYVILNKPGGVVTTADDPEGRKTVVELVHTKERLYPVGRLDYHTTGLILLTNDGTLAHRMMHPSFGVDKTYRILAEGRVPASVAKALSDGIQLEDGMTAPAKARIVQAGDEKSLLELTIHEGRNRQVRRMMDAVGHPVIELVRTGYGPLTLGDLALGKHRNLTPAEIRRLYKAAGMAPKRHRDRDGKPVEDPDDEPERSGPKAPKKPSRAQRTRARAALAGRPAPKKPGKPGKTRSGKPKPAAGDAPKAAGKPKPKSSGAPKPKSSGGPKPKPGSAPKPKRNPRKRPGA